MLKKPNTTMFLNTTSDRLNDSEARKSLLFQQRDWLTNLFDRGWTRSAVSQEIGVRPETVSAWFEMKSLARAGARSQLQSLHISKKSAPESSREGVGKISIEERQKRDEIERRYDLYEPVARARRIRQLAEEMGIKLSDLPRLLGADRDTIKNYVKPNYEGHIALPILERLVSIIEMSSQSLTSGISLEDRFQLVAQRLFGPYYETGFPPYSAERRKALNILSSFTHSSKRSLYRYLPPYGKERVRPSIILLANMEALADSLEKNANLLTSRKLRASSDARTIMTRFKKIA